MSCHTMLDLLRLPETKAFRRCRQARLWGLRVNTSERHSNP